MTLIHASLMAMTAALVFGLGWKFSVDKNPLIGGGAALLLFLLHPAQGFGAWRVSAWDAFFAASFFLAWSATSSWSLFMRSWVLAGLYAFGLWIGSSIVFWIPLVLLLWIFRSRKPLDAAISMLTILLGGLAFFLLTWALHWLLDPAVTRPASFQWVRWSLPTLQHCTPFSWALLAASAVIEPIRMAFLEKRASVPFVMALMAIVLALIGSTETALASVAISAPLVAGRLTRREFLFQRTARQIVLLAALGMGASLFWIGPHSARLALLTLIILGLLWRSIKKVPLLSWRTVAEAACLGSFVGEAIGSWLLR